MVRKKNLWYYFTGFVYIESAGHGDSLQGAVVVATVESKETRIVQSEFIVLLKTHCINPVYVR